MSTPTIIQSRNSGPATRTTFTFTPSTTGAGHALVIILANQAAATLTGTTVTDGAGNVYTKLKTSGTVTGGRYVELWGAKNCAATTSIVCTNPSANVCWTFIEFGSVSANPFDASNANAAASANTTTACQVTPTAASGLVFCYTHWNSNTKASITINTGVGYALDTTSTIENNAQYALSTSQTAGVATGVSFAAPTLNGYGQITLSLAGSGAPPPPSGGATATIVQARFSGPAVRASYTFTPVTTGNDHLLAIILCNQAATAPGGVSIVDSANTWTKLGNTTAGTGRYLELWVVAGSNPTSSIVCNNTSATLGWQFLEIAGCPPTSPVDVFGFNQGNTASTTSAATATPSQTGDLAVSFVHANTNVTSAITAPTGSYVIDSTDLIEGNGNLALLNGPPISVATGPAWSLGTAQGWGAVTFLVKNAFYKGQYKQPGGTLHKYVRNWRSA